jgi:hypothetical protein
MDQEQINDLIDKGVSVGSKVQYTFPKRTKQKPTTGIPASKHVAEAVLAKHITPSEGRSLNPSYLQHVPGGSKTVKKVAKPAPKKKAAKKTPASPAYEIRVVNGREFKVYNVPEDKSIPQKVRKEEKNATRTIYRSKGISY